MSALGALYRRERTGQGAVIDVSMFDAAVEWMGHPLYMQLYGGSQIPRMGLSHAAIAPYDAYPTADGQILIGVQNDRGWRSLLTDVFAAPEYVDDPRFARNVDRVAQPRRLRRAGRGLAREAGRPPTSTSGSRKRASRRPSSTPTADVLAHPQLAERDRWRTVSTPAGDIRGVLPPMTYRDVELPMGAVPALGEHNDAILAELGLSGDHTDHTEIPDA